jgi:hypothetical protein
LDVAISRQSLPDDPARIIAMIASKAGFAYFGCAAFVARLLRLDEKIASGLLMSLRRVANILNTDAALPQGACDGLSKYGDKSTDVVRGRAGG